MEYRELKRELWRQYDAFNPKWILIEDKASGTQLIQELIFERLRGVKPYRSKLDKIMRMHSASGLIENGFVYLPEKAHWLHDYLTELAIFPQSKYDDQVDATSQALDWFKSLPRNCVRVYEVEVSH